ncbi:MAG: PilT/PilU family type 4a pilus ATPase, partial [Candidatus Omnitrophica bacterium]|nr:PilT/PilU family type 4a pilus ATPase [Candidatus Omnitrophota bacterium]
APEGCREELLRGEDRDFSCHWSGGRMRVSVLTQKGRRAGVFRMVPNSVGDFDSLHMPAGILQSWALKQRGLLLFTGPTGSGKSTTVASMISYMNQNQARHILTFEDPIEFVYQDERCIINQREIGTDLETYEEGLKHAMYQSPDVLFVSDIRDAATADAALRAAETGHLVIGVLHAPNAVKALPRMVNLFPPHLREDARSRLGLVLQGIMGLRLVRRTSGEGRIPACEVLVASPTIREAIEEGRLGDITPLMEDGADAGMCSFRQSLVKLIREGSISQEEAFLAADSVQDLQVSLSGIKR